MRTSDRFRSKLVRETMRPRSWYTHSAMEEDRPNGHCIDITFGESEESNTILYRPRFRVEMTIAEAKDLVGQLLRHIERREKDPK